MDREKIFYDIEHAGDFEYTFEPLRNAGAKILGWRHNYDAEQLTVRFELPSDSPEIVKKFYEDLKKEMNDE